MITRREMLEILLDACPSFTPRLMEFLEKWESDPDPPLYVALGMFARHVITMQERGETSELIVVFRAVERLLVEGDGYVRKGAAVGVLETLQNRRLHSTTTPGEFMQYLRPESARYWHSQNRFWEGKMKRDPGGA